MGTGKKDIFAAGIFKAGIFKAGIVAGGGAPLPVGGGAIKNNPGCPCCDVDLSCLIQENSLKDYDEASGAFEWLDVDPLHITWTSSGVDIDAPDVWIFSSIKHPESPYQSRITLDASCEDGSVIEIYFAATLTDNAGTDELTGAVIVQIAVTQDCLELKVVTKVDSVDTVQAGPWYWRHGGTHLGSGFASGFSIDALYDSNTGEVYVEIKKSITPTSPESNPASEEHTFSKWATIEGFVPGDRVGFGTGSLHSNKARFVSWVWNYLSYTKNEEVTWCPSPVTCVLVDENFATWPTPICDWTEVYGSGIGIEENSAHLLIGTGNALVIHNNPIQSDWESFFTVRCNLAVRTIADNQVLGIVFWSNAAGTSYYVAEFDYGAGVDQYGATAGISRIRKVDGGTSETLVESEGILLPENHFGLCVSTSSTKIIAQLPGGNLSVNVDSADRFGDHIGFLIDDMGSTDWLASEFISKKRGPLYERDGTVSVSNCSDCGGGFACDLCENGTPDEYMFVFEGVKADECGYCYTYFNKTVIIEMESACQADWLAFGMEDCSKIVNDGGGAGDHWVWAPYTRSWRYDFRFINEHDGTFRLQISIWIAREWGADYYPWVPIPPSAPYDWEIHTWELLCDVPYDCRGISNLELPYLSSVIGKGLTGYENPDYILCNMSDTKVHITAI